MIQVQAFLKNLLAQFTLGSASGQTQFSAGFYAGVKRSSIKGLTGIQTLIRMSKNIDLYTYEGRSGALLDK